MSRFVTKRSLSRPRRRPPCRPPSPPASCRLVVGGAGEEAVLAEAPLPVVHEEEVRHRVVRDVEILVAVAVEVGEDHAQVLPLGMEKAGARVASVKVPSMLL